MKSDKHEDLLNNATYGFFAGVLTGMAVATPEFLKVECQRRHVSLFRAIKDAVRTPDGRWSIRTNTTQSLLLSVPQFSMLFGAVCALEFSVNDEIKKQYGTAAGIAASGVTGATFLTVADHLMFRSQGGSSYRQSLSYFKAHPNKMAIFTGFSPMFIRESFFMLTISSIGPYLGRMLEAMSRQSGNEKSDSAKPLDWRWNFLGTIISGAATTTASQPFDSVTRAMQKELQAQPKSFGSRPSFVGTFWNNIGKNTFYKGFAARFPLAAFGAASASSIYGQLKGLGESRAERKSSIK